jgi:cyclophilin family peptidyl-prolyl cis-trans isomerase
MIDSLTKALCALVLAAATLPALAGNPKVLIETNQGNITLELDAQKAPLTVANFLRYVDEGFYTGTVFHRVIDNFMIQGGGMDTNLHEKTTQKPIANEADNGLTNLRGTVAMARTNQPDSATAQFFINVVDNHFLDFREKSRRGWGYAVFGRVIDGLATVDKIAKLPTTARPDGNRDVPIEPPVMQRVSRIIEGSPKKP